MSDPGAFPATSRTKVITRYGSQGERYRYTVLTEFGPPVLVTVTHDGTDGVPHDMDSEWHRPIVRQTILAGPNIPIEETFESPDGYQAWKATSLRNAQIVQDNAAIARQAASH